MILNLLLFVVAVPVATAYFAVLASLPFVAHSVSSNPLLWVLNMFTVLSIYAMTVVGFQYGWEKGRVRSVLNGLAQGIFRSIIGGIGGFVLMAAIAAPFWMGWLIYSRMLR